MGVLPVIIQALNVICFTSSFRCFMTLLSEPNQLEVDRFRSSSQGTFAFRGPLFTIRQCNKYVNQEIYSDSYRQNS